MWKFLQAERDSDVPQVLESLDVPGIVKYIQSEGCKNVFVMAGAGISTSAGIPDFRSPDTGLYANLARLNLPYPEAVFDISYFRRNPKPFYTLAHELAPGQFRPTPTHSFIRLLAEKNKLHTCFTQNIDTLERMAGVPGDKIIEAHGSFADQHCIECKAKFPDEQIKEMIRRKEIPKCENEKCGGLVKPDIVFFGESLPPSFHRGIRNLRDADLLIVMGTSLTVQPFASLIQMVPEDCPRVLINLDHVGGWGSRMNDVAILKKCDEAVRLIAKSLGWEQDLERLWAETAPPGTNAEEEGDKDAEGEEEEPVEKALTEEERLKEQVDKLTQEVEQNLKIAEEHKEQVKQDLDKEKESDVETEKEGVEKSPGEKEATSVFSGGRADRTIQDLIAERMAQGVGIPRSKSS